MATAGNIVIELKVDESGMITGVSNAGAALKKFQSSVEQTTSAVKRMADHHDSLETKFRHTVMTLGHLRFAVMDVHDVFLRLPLAIMKSAGELEKMQVLMRGLSKETTAAGKAAEGVKNFEYITNFAKKAPFEINALSDSFVKMKTAGIDPTNGSMEALVDSVARFGGTSETLKRASVAIQQMSGKGVISMEELRQQLGEAVPTAMQAMADGMGVSMAELSNIVKTGALQATVPLQKMLLQMRIDNQGAAAEMMKTWEGALSGLKTEWSLTSLFIANNGFGDAAKNAVGDLTSGLRSSEFKTFASNVGAELGKSVTTIAESVKWMMKYRDEIGMAAQAWIAYKVAFSLVPGISKAITDASKITVEGFRKERAAAADNLTFKQREVVEAAALTAAKQSAHASNLRMLQEELQAVRMKNAFVIAQDAQITNAMKTRRAQSLADIAATVAANNADKAARVQLAATNAALTASERQLTAAIAGETAALASATAAAGAASTAKIALISTSRLSAAASVAMAAATRAAGVALSALGGPLGVAIMAITGLVYWWGAAARASEESADRQRRAAQGVSNAADVAAFEQEKLSAKRERDFAEKEKNSDKNLYSGLNGKKKTAEDRLRDATALETADKKYRDVVAKSAQASKALENSTNRERVDNINRGADEATEKLRLAAVKKIAEIERGAETELKGMDKSSKQYQQAVNKINSEKRNAYLDGLQQQISLEKRMEKTARDAALAKEKGKEGSGSAEFLIAEARKAKADELQRKLDSDRATVDAKIVMNKPEKKGGAKGSGGTDHLAKLLGDFQEKNAALEEEIKGLESADRRVNAVAAMLKETQKKFDNGDYDDKVTGPDGKGKVVKKADSGKLALVQAAMKENIELAELKNAEQKVIDQLNDMKPKLEDALEVLDDPMNTKKDGKGEAGFKKFLASLKKDVPGVEQVFKRLGLSADEMQGKFKLIDNSAAIQKMVEETRTLNDSVVADNREAAKAKMLADDEAHRAKMQQIVNELKGVDMIRGAEAQRALDANSAARLASTLKKSESPMQKLASEWANTTKNMEEATARWANSTVDAITNTVMTGKLEWKDLASSILKDMLKIQVQKTLGGAIQGGMEWIGAQAAKFIPGLGGAGEAASSVTSTAAKTAETAAVTAATTAMTTLSAQAMADAAANATQSATELTQFAATSAAMTTLTSSLAAASVAATRFAATAAGAGASSASGGILGGILSIFSGASATPFSADQFAMPDQMILPDVVFADGGIMTNLGPVPLRKYAAGGIANSPQLALYGEAGPEAYVPLPDGRSIPVTMTGAGGGGGQNNVTIQINVSAGGEQGETKATGNADQWMGMAQKIRGVVREEIASNQRPGGLLYK